MSSLRVFSFVLAFLAIVVVSYGQNYCDMRHDHTMCRFQNPGPVCNAKVSSLNPDQQNEIVNLHNEYRQRVASGNEGRGSPGPQPAARHMPNMVWDHELATIAQRWANQCQYGHDDFRNVPRFGVGQSVAKSWATGTEPSSIRDLVSIWYNEVALFNHHQVEKFSFDMSTAHYTQMVWADSTKIGCGFVNYMNGNENTVILVCNYGPTGNIQDARIYERR